jgi:hypothetical protein
MDLQSASLGAGRRSLRGDPESGKKLVNAALAMSPMMISIT